MTKELIGRGKLLTEAVGSIDNFLSKLRTDFYQQFPDNYSSSTYSYISEVFEGYVIVRSAELDPDIYYKVNYTKSNNDFSFADKPNWTVVGLTYKPVSVQESYQLKTKKKNKFRDVTESQVEVVESMPDGSLKVKVIGLNANKKTGNNRVYPDSVVQESIARLALSGKLNESAGQGRYLTGEADHPRDKGNTRPLILETVYRWDKFYLNESKQLIAEGLVIPTRNGQDLITLIKNKVPIPHSIRGNGESETDSEGTEIVTYLELTGLDASQTASDQTTGIIEFKESEDKEAKKQKKLLGVKMNELLKKLMAKFPKVFEGYTKEALESMGDVEVSIIEKSIKASLGLQESDDLFAGIDEFEKKQKEVSESQTATAVATQIDESTKNLKFGDVLNAQFISEVKKQKFESVEAVKKFCESLVPAYSSVAAQIRLNNIGLNSSTLNNMRVSSVLETETGTPEYARASHEISESIVNSDLSGRLKAFNPNKLKTVNDKYAANYLKWFDSNPKNQKALLEESKLFSEAQLTTDLNLPVSITRMIIEQALPQLIATSVFDTGFAQAQNETIWFEHYTSETGFTVSIIAAEAIAAPTPAVDGYVQLANRRITVGTLVLKNAAEAVTYTEGVDYTVDYAEGIIWFLTGSAVADGQALHVTAYTYSAVRKAAELAPIERLKNTLDSMVMTVRPDRIAMALSNDVVIFSQTQLGYDAYQRVMRNLIFTHARLVDTGIFHKAISVVLRVASNSGGTWNQSGNEPTSGLISKLGVAKILVMKRHYEPRSYLMSITNLDYLSKDPVFAALNSRADATLNANGFAGRVNGLPIFMSTEWPDNMILCNNPELVMHRVLQSGTMRLDGPHQMMDTSTNPAKLLAGKEWYIEEYNGAEAPVKEKASYTLVS